MNFRILIRFRDLGSHLASIHHWISLDVFVAAVDLILKLFKMEASILLALKHLVVQKVWVPVYSILKLINEAHHPFLSLD